jgi:CubicO group peptidase (beta-lactamase class C family)
MHRILFALFTLLPVAAQSSGLDAFVAERAKAQGFAGTVLVEQQGQPRYTRSFGLANAAFGVTNATDTRYRIASITKAFTAVLVLQLRDRGKLDLDRTFDAYLPDYPGEAARKVTVHQLLNHTSGLPNIDAIPNIEDNAEAIEAARRDAVAHGRLPLYQTPYTSDDIYAKFCADALVAKPGERFDYNNADYVILGKIVERLYGESYDAVLKAQILDPLKLADTGIAYHRNVVKRLAEPYSRAADGTTFEHDMPVYPENWYAAGALYSSAADVLTFSNALFGGKLVGKDSLARMTTPGLDGYGYGVWARDIKVGDRKFRAVTRPGRIMGTRAQLMHVAERGLTIVMLSNNGADLDAFSRDVAQQLLGAR